MNKSKVTHLPIKILSFFFFFWLSIWNIINLSFENYVMDIIFRPVAELEVFQKVVIGFLKIFETGEHNLAINLPLVFLGFISTLLLWYLYKEDRILKTVFSGSAIITAFLWTLAKFTGEEFIKIISNFITLWFMVAPIVVIVKLIVNCRNRPLEPAEQ